MKPTCILICCLFFSFKVLAQDKLLIYTHNGEGYVHENIPFAVKALEKLAKENGYTTFATDDPAFFTPENLKTFEVIIFANTNNEAFDTDEQKKVFQSYIRSGGGFVGIHSACGSERQWPWYWSMLGGKFVRHPPLQSFDLKVIDSKHPATNFLGEKWSWEDEPYYMDHFNPDIQILLAADLNSIDDEKKGEYPGTVFGHYAPIAWCHEFDGGRQFYTALGHKKEYYRDENFLKHLLGGIQWVLDKDNP